MPHATGPTTINDLWTCAGICVTAIAIVGIIASATIESKRIDMQQRIQIEDTR